MKTILRALALLLTGAFGQLANASDDRVGVMGINPSPSPTSQEAVFAADYDSPSAMLSLIGAPWWRMRLEMTPLSQCAAC